MAGLRIDFRGNIIIDISDVDQHKQVRLRTMDNESSLVCLDKQDAIQIIQHLQEQFEIKPLLLQTLKDLVDQVEMFTKDNTVASEYFETEIRQAKQLINSATN